MKDDEARLLSQAASGNPPWGKNMREIVDEADYINPKRAWRILEKWTRKGWYQYGVGLGAGWLTEKGKAAAQRYEVDV